MFFIILTACCDKQIILKYLYMKNIKRLPYQQLGISDVETFEYCTYISA